MQTRASRIELILSSLNGLTLAQIKTTFCVLENCSFLFRDKLALQACWRSFEYKQTKREPYLIIQSQFYVYYY